MSTQPQKQYLNYLSGSNFQEVNRLFVLSFESEAHRGKPKGYFPPKVEIKN